MTKSRLYIPHIDKTGGQSVEKMLCDNLTRLSWTYDVNGGSDFPDPIPEAYARIGMHQSYDPDIMDDSWLKVLIIRDPLERFVSTYNFYKFEMWRDTGSVINLTIDQYCAMIRMKNMGKTSLAAKHLGPNAPIANIKYYAENALDAFPWSMFMSPRGYVSPITSLNAEQPMDGFQFTVANIFDQFDCIIRTETLSELGDVLDPLGLKIDPFVHVNSREQHAKWMDMDPASHVFSVYDLTELQKQKIEAITEFQEEAAMWSTYNHVYRRP